MTISSNHGLPAVEDINPVPAALDGQMAVPNFHGIFLLESNHEERISVRLMCSSKRGGAVAGAVDA